MMLDRKKCLRLILAAELTAFIVGWGVVRTVGTYHLQHEHFEQRQAVFFMQGGRLWEQKLFKLCIEATQQVLPHSRFYPQARQLKQDCENAWVEALLKQAQELARKGSYQSAIYTIYQIPRGHPRDERAEELILEWSLRMLALAEEVYLRATGFPDEAIAIALAIPNFSPLYPEVKAKIARWQSEWNQNLKLEREARALLEEDRVAAARHAAEQIDTTHPHWQTQREEILNAIAQRRGEQEKERQAFWMKISLLLMGSGLSLGFVLVVRRFQV